MWNNIVPHQESQSVKILQAILPVIKELPSERVRRSFMQLLTMLGSGISVVYLIMLFCNFYA